MHDLTSLPDALQLRCDLATMWRFLRNMLILLLLVAVLIATGVAVLLWSTLPPRSQEAHIPGLAAPVAIGFDADGIPRIQAANDTDAAAALGFVHARDRIFRWN